MTSRKGNTLSHTAVLANHTDSLILGEQSLYDGSAKADRDLIVEKAVVEKIRN